MKSIQQVSAVTFGHTERQTYTHTVKFTCARFAIFRYKRITVNIKCIPVDVAHCLRFAYTKALLYARLFYAILL